MAEDTVMEAESSTASEVTQDEGSTEDHAQSSSAETDAPESTESLLDVVQNVLDEPSEEKIEATDSSPTEGEPEDDQSEEFESDDVEASEDEDPKDRRLNKHPRFRQLIAEKNRFKEGAEQYDRIKNFMRQSGLSPQEVTEGFRVMGLMKNDPAEAYKVLRKQLGNLADATGARIPKDIKQKVDEGYIDADSARELSRNRAELNRERGLRQQLEEQKQKQRTQQQSEQIGQSIKDWEAKVSQSDPDYSLKQDEILDRVKAMVAERGMPGSSESGVEYLTEAYDTVTERHRSRVPAAKPLRTVQGGKLSGSPSPQPKSLMEVVEMELAEG